jgi:antitoxin HicB
VNSHYGMVIQWPDEDQCYVVFLPDFEGRVNQPCTDGETYEEAAKHGQEVIETLIEYFQEAGKPLPKPKTFPQKPLEDV